MLTGATLLRASRVMIVAVLPWALTTSATTISVKRLTIVSGPPANAGLPVMDTALPMKVTKVPGRVTNQSVPAWTPSNSTARITVPDASTKKIVNKVDVANLTMLNLLREIDITMRQN